MHKRSGSVIRDRLASAGLPGPCERPVPALLALPIHERLTADDDVTERERELVSVSENPST
jgi:hypothetical protein